MLPPVDPEVLRNNPDFAKLYATLTKDILNTDGTVKKRSPEEAQDEESIKEFNEHRYREIKADIIANAISSVTPPSDASPELTSLLVILPPLLSRERTLSPEEESLLFSNPPLSNLPSLLPDLAALLAPYLDDQLSDIAHVLRPSGLSSSLASHVARLQRQARQSSEKADQARTRVIEALSELGRVQNEAIAALITQLETKHGVVAESLELRAREVALSAAQTERDAEKALDDAHRVLYSPEVDSALANYMAHLKDARMRAEERVRAAKKQLARYGVGDDDGGEKERMMLELAEERREILRQINEVTQDLTRLNRS